MSLVNYGFTSNKQDGAVQQEKEEELQNSEQLIVNKTKKQQLSKKQKWNDAFTELGFVKIQTKTILRLAVFSARSYTTIHQRRSIN